MFSHLGVCVALLLLYTVLIVADILNMHCYNLLSGCPDLIASCMNVWTHTERSGNFRNMFRIKH